MRFIHAADLHLDSPLRGLSDYEGAPVERLRGSTRGAFERLIDLAISEKVDFVLLSGDIFDADWPSWNSGLYFRERLAHLGRAGIRVFLIHGNHDAQGVISRQLHLPDNVTTFSSRAAETKVLEDLGVAIHGQSFPNRAVDEDLAKDYPTAVPGYYNIAMLHTSLSGRPGHDNYAPTTVEVLESKNFNYWALGHVHMRETVCESPLVVYPGNLQGRHANETGAKGCMLVTVEGGKTIAEFQPLDIVRWNRIELDLSQATRIEDMRPLFEHALKPILAGATDKLHALRITIKGASALQQIEANQPGTLQAQLEGWAQDVSEADIWIERVVLDLSAPASRAQLLGREDALGELARLVDSIGATDESLSQWVREQLVDMPESLAGERADERAVKLDVTNDLRALLADAEATVLARIAPPAQGGKPQ